MISDQGRENVMTVTERMMGWRMLGAFLCNHIGNQTLRQISGVKDIVLVIRESEIWTSRVTEWYSQGKKRPSADFQGDGVRTGANGELRLNLNTNEISKMKDGAHMVVAVIRYKITYYDYL